MEASGQLVHPGKMLPLPTVYESVCAQSLPGRGGDEKHHFSAIFGNQTPVIQLVA
jgi:hypothetical protein